MSFKLSKSVFMKGVQCPKAIWLQMKKKQVASPPDENQEAIFEQGRKVGDLAKDLYPNGVEIPFNTQPFSEKFRLTAQYVQDKKTIYEATVGSETMMCMVDILHHGPDGWELIEVKSSTSEKEEHIIDIALQYHILKEAGIPIVKAKLIYINNHYYRGHQLDLTQYFIESDITEKVMATQEKIQKFQTQFSSVLSQYQEPDQVIGPHCTSPYPCSFKGYCWQHVPDYSVFNLIGLPFEEKFELYYKGYLSILDIPHPETLPKRVQEQIQTEKSKETLIKKPEIESFLNTLHYPMAFLDFETIFSAIPPFHMTKAYQQVPFQYSLHLMNSPFDVPSHHEFIGDGIHDPREALIKQMIKDIPKEACILVYNEKFEKMVIQDLIMAFPNYEKELQQLHDQIIDLMAPFEKRYLYTHTMNGRYSIKKVLPTFVPELSYDDLEIQDGLVASRRYANLNKIAEQTQRNAIRQQLLDYCKLDTYAMVKLLAVLYRYL